MKATMQKAITAILASAVVCFFIGSVSYAGTIKVGLDTSQLIGGSFSIIFDLIGGDTLGDNTLTIRNLSFGGGAPIGNSSLIGGASGDLSTSISLTDAEFLNSFYEGFIPGTLLSFDLDLTTNFVTGETPDRFALYILDDATGLPIPTTDTLASAFLVIDLESFPVIQTFGSDSPDY